MLKKIISSKKIELESGSGRKSSARIRSRRSMHEGKKLSAEIAALEVRSSDFTCCSFCSGTGTVRPCGTRGETCVTVSTLMTPRGMSRD